MVCQGMAPGSYARDDKTLRTVSATFWLRHNKCFAQLLAYAETLPCNTAFTVSARFSGVNPKYLKRTLAGADSP
jgi:hypothetical protein